MKVNFLLTLVLFVLLFDTSATGHVPNSDTLLVHYTPIQCDSLIQANATNPDFVVMDVRTPSEYNPDHLEEAINRDYYAPNFNYLINLLPRHKMYVLYCSGGSRSMMTFNLMITKGFTKLVNMLGGISAWKSASLPTTPDFAPLQMAVSDTVVENDTVNIGMVDTIYLTVTNRANDILHFTSITSLAGSEFSTDFNMTKTLEGPFDYTFSIFYTPVDEQDDSVSILIGSNGGDVQFHISRSSKIPLSATTEPQVDQWKIYPNPFSSSVKIVYEIPAPCPVEFIIYNSFGQVIDRIVQLNVQKGENRMTWDAEGLPTGVYFYRFNAGTQRTTGKMVKF